MKVSELIVALSAMPQDIPVKAWEDAPCDYDDVVEVQLTERKDAVWLVTGYGRDEGK